MRRITARDLHVVVAGALASKGFHALINVSYGIAAHRFTSDTAIWVLIGLLLPLSIAVLFYSKIALLLTRIYLGITLIGELGAFVSSEILGTKEFHIQYPGAFVAGAMFDAILLALLLWSKSRRFSDA
jgi:hypothetical protein